jgi:hypothetical protein
MHLIINHAAQNANHQAASANHAVVCGQTAVGIVTASKRPLGRKRLSILAKYLPERSSSGTMRMPECSSPRRTVTSGRRPVVRTFPGGGTRPWTAGDTPAAIWATLVITRALSS